MKHEKTFEAINKLKEVEIELHRLKNALEMANKALDAKYEHGFIDGMQKQMQSSVDKAVNAMGKREWVGLKDEPVAWGMETDGLIYDVICPEEHEREEGEYTIPLYTAPQPKQEQSEPVAWMTENKYLITKDENLAKQIKEQGDEPIIPLYTTPQHTWVGLTEEDLKLLSAEWRIVYGAWMDDFARDIEAKLKEKNNG